MRGEYADAASLRAGLEELPPRARRIRTRLRISLLRFGTTSACAENTTGGPGRTTSWRNYLRVRGEYTGETYTDRGLSELPPRARRIPVASSPPAISRRTTSACAENTRHVLETATPAWNYLRVRGEYGELDDFYRNGLELPPRARRIPVSIGSLIVTMGTTSACAENTPHF